jgi:tetratricopeptide (TPR) repeat protein
MVSVALLPREQELRVMYMKGQRYEQARAEFENQLARGDLSVSIVMPLKDLYVHFGEIDKAVALLERFVKDHPDNVSALRVLAKLYGDSMRPAEQIATLETLHRLHPGEKALRELVALYDLHGPYEKKIAAFDILVRDYGAGHKETLEVAFHHASHGRHKQALDILSKPGVHDLSLEVEELRAGLMLEIGDREKARVTAVKWLRYNYDAASLERFLHLFQNRGEDGEALKILNNFEEKITGEPKLLLLRAELEMEQGQNDRAIAQIRDLSREGRLSGEEFAGLLTRAVSAQKGGFALRLASEAAPEKLADKTLASIAETALREGQPEVMKPLLVKYGDGALSSRPVLAGHLQGRLASAAGAGLPASSLKNWQRDLSTLLDLARWHADSNSRAASGLPDKGAVSRALLARLSQGALTDAGKLEVLTALSRLKVKEPLLAHLEAPALEQGGPYAELYEQTLLRVGGEASPRLAIFRARMNSTPVETKRAIALRLIDEQQTAQAETILRELALNAPPESEDVRTLISLWAKPLEPRNRDWLIDRTRQSTGDTQAAWMLHLLKGGAAHAVVRLVGDEIPPANDAVFDRYLEALVTLRDGPRFAAALEPRLRGPAAGERWMIYATWAEGLDRYTIAKQIYAKLLKAEPERLDPLPRLGAMAYREGRWSEVVDTLGPFLAREAGDWKTNYYFSEAHFYLGNSFEAQKYSLQALERMDAKPEENLTMRVARAYCLKRLGRKNEAVTAFRQLLNQKNGDAAFRSRMTAALGELKAANHSTAY